MKKCILCGDDLDTEVTNLEHYVPATAIRNFDKLRVPKKMGWALRQNYCDEDLQDKYLGTISSHKQWATVRVHKRCNQDASHMCEDLKYIIDHLGQNIPERKFKSIIEYYAYFWKVPESDIVIDIMSPQDVDSLYGSASAFRMYRTGYLDLCSIRIYSKSLISYDNEPGVEKHWIWIGTNQALS